MRVELTVRMYYPNDTWDEVKVTHVPRVGETIHWSPTGGHMRTWKVDQVEWFIAPGGLQDVVVVLAEP